MAVLYYHRILEGTNVAGRLAEPMSITEVYQIRVDSPNTNKAEIVSATAVGWGTVHPEFPLCIAQEFSLTPVDRTGMLWHLTVVFSPPLPGKKLDASNIPEDVWEMQAGVSTFPLFQDRDGGIITNAAGDPLEGLTIERSTFTLLLTRCYTTDLSLTAAIGGYTDTVNDDVWFGFSAKTVKASFRSATLREAQVYADQDSEQTIKWIEAKWEFEYNKNTWKSKPWDVGFMELTASGRQAILGLDDLPVRQPVALNADGTAKTAGTAPSVINSGAGVDIYEEEDFATAFGTPVFIPVT